MAEGESKKYGPSVKLGFLYERTSKNGVVYYSGRLGLANIAILQSRDKAPDGTTMWDILLTQAPPKTQEPQK